jgi:hypothetical protein
MDVAITVSTTGLMKINGEPCGRAGSSYGAAHDRVARMLLELHRRQESRDRGRALARRRAKL